MVAARALDSEDHLDLLRDGAEHNAIGVRRSSGRQEKAPAEAGAKLIFATARGGSVERTSPRGVILRSGVGRVEGEQVLVVSQFDFGALLAFGASGHQALPVNSTSMKRLFGYFLRKARRASLRPAENPPSSASGSSLKNEAISPPLSFKMRTDIRTPDPLLPINILNA
jgi:hypothetical protein